MNGSRVQHSGQLPTDLVRGLNHVNLSFSCDSLEQLNHRTETNHLRCKVAFPLERLSWFAGVICSCLNALLCWRVQKWSSQSQQGETSDTSLLRSGELRREAHRGDLPKVTLLDGG